MFALSCCVFFTGFYFASITPDGLYKQKLPDETRMLELKPDNTYVERYTKPKNSAEPYKTDNGTWQYVRDIVILSSATLKGEDATRMYKFEISKLTRMRKNGHIYMVKDRTEKLRKVD